MTVVFVTAAVTSALYPGTDTPHAAHATHVSVPVIIMDGARGHVPGADVVIAGWVDYGGSPASDVLLGISVSDPSGLSVTESNTVSGPDGGFSYSFALPEGSMAGDYAVIVTSMCRDEHRQICAHRADNVTIRVHDGHHRADPYIPQWVRIVAGFWVDHRIDDDAFARAVGFLIRDNVMVIPGLQGPGADGASDLPEWIRESTALWVSGHASDAEFAKGVAWMVDARIIMTDVQPRR